LEELIAVDRRYEDLYRAAQGGPDALGQPNAQGQAEFLDMLAKANTLKKEKKDEPQLFEDTRKLIDVIFNTSPSGKQDLVKIKDSFVRGDNHVALFQLLDAYPKPPEDKVKEYADNLETLRAAYKMDAKALADLVAAKIAPEKE
jgi:organic radical activating enzyme